MRATLRFVRLACFVLLGLTGLGFAPRPAAAQTNVMFIVDASGSMKKPLAAGQESRMDAAKRALGEALAAIPADARLGLTLYGHRRAKDCSDIELVAPIGADPASALATRIAALQPKGETPIAESLKQATRSFSAFQGQSNRIVLVTDGIEECGGDPCAAAQAVKDAGLELKVDVVGFTLDAAQRKTVECVAAITGGTYYDAQNAGGLTSALSEVRQAMAQAAPPPPPPAPAKPTALNLLSPKNGGAILTTPSDVWLATNDDQETWVTWMRTGEEAVYAFQGEQPATFDTFAVLITGASGGNPKEIELLAGDDGPTGQFRAIATCAFQNMKMVQKPYQECTFAPVTARYLKVKLGQCFLGDGYVGASEFRLMGQPGQAAPPAASPPAAAPSSGAVNLLSPKNGGAILTTPSDVWLATNDDQEAAVTWMRTGEEAVYAFQGERPATFDTFSVLIGGAWGGNPAAIELLAGDDGPTGQFRAIATCAFQNLKMVQKPYQECTFAPVTARYLKVKLGQCFLGDGYVGATEFRLMGQPGR